MTEDEFARAVLEASGPGLRTGAIRAAIREYLDAGRLRPFEVSSCVIRAGQLDRENQIPRADRPAEKTLPLPNTPASRVTARERLRAMRGWLEERRQELFGQTDPPFDLMEDGEKWLLDEQDSAVDMAVGEFRVLPYRDESYTSGTIFETSLDGVRILPPGSENCAGAGTFVRPGTKGYILAVATEQMAKHSGFTQASLVRLVLAGEVPTLPAPRAVIRSRPSSGALYGPMVGRLWPRRISIEIEECDLDHKSLQDIYRALRKRLGNLKAKTVSPKDEALDAIVSELGGLPNRSYSRQFWSPVVRLWRERGLGLESAKTLQTRYLRLRKRIRTANKSRAPAK